ncbi:tetratricopeptide repeat protein [Leptospira fainei serovar Hurstbridge str. BUT 6]|uniref:Tetratricopeptide repeat protein n=1 Tax=Leptospira fainei serovar Hurstbridge str. BUT 6 TaxID=1193011 RepID=S3V144_9LEPT|nr:tetratricopeptide repeat protein [Leptospira fainei]EPG75168.1 tetratricopeptide repeat protein [Leptospira fainei serovar Hurstbridge str. BUT 6]
MRILIKDKFLFYNIFTILSILVLSWASPIFSKETIEWIKEGESALKSRNYADAYDAFREAIQKNPQSVRSHLGLSEAALRLHKEKEALRSLNKVLELEPKNKTAVKTKAVTLSKLGQYEEALTVIRPFLDEDRYDTDLFPVLVEVQLAQGNTEKATFELNSASSRMPKNREIRMLEARVAALGGNFSKAQALRSQLESETSDDPSVFLESGKFLLLWSEKLSGNRRDSKIQESAEKLERAVALYPDEEEALRLLAKTRIYSGRYMDAEEFLNRLLTLFPTSTEYLYLRSFARLKKDPNSKEGRTDLERLLSLDDLDPFIRERAETLCLETLPEGNNTRRTLGEYRLQRFRANRNSFLYDLAWVHLMRARELLPNRPEILVLVLEEYKRRGLFPQYFNLLLTLREKFPDNKKYGYAIENNLDNFKKTLSYREGLIKIGEFGIEEDYGRTPPELLIFDLETEDFLSKHPDAPVIAGKAIRSFLSKDPRIRAVDLDSFRKKEGLDQEPYSGAIIKTEKNFSQIKTVKGESLRFVASGKLSFKNGALRMEWTLRDRKEEKNLGTFRVYAKGRDALSEATLRSRDKLLSLIPAMGRVHRVKEDSIIINAGIIDGIAKGSTLYLYNSSAKVGEAIVQEADLYTSKAIPKNTDEVLRTLAVGNRAYWHKTKEVGSE